MGLGLSSTSQHLKKQADSILGGMVFKIQDPSVKIQDSGPQRVMVVLAYCLSQRSEQARREAEGYHWDVLIQSGVQLEGRQ